MILPIVQDQIIVTVTGPQITVSKVTAITAEGIVTQTLFQGNPGDFVGPLSAIQNAIFQAV